MALRIIDVIEWPDQGPADIMQRIPESGQGDIRFGSQLIVRPSQVALFVRDGKVIDTFTEGRHTLEAKNLPILTGILKLATNNKTPFPAEVYFVTTKDFLDMKWGTAGEITVPDNVLGMVQLKAFGSYAMNVADPRRFVEQIVGVQGMYTTKDIQEYLRDVLLSEIAGVFGNTMKEKSLLDLAELQPKLGPAIKEQAADDFLEVGINLKKVVMASVQPSEAVQKAIAQRGALGAIGVNYMQYQAGEAMRDAARNPNGMAGLGASLGAGMGMGQVMGAAVASAINQPLPTPDSIRQGPVVAAAGAAAAAAAPTNKAQIREAMLKLDMRVANGEISETLYNKLTDNLSKALDTAAGE